jgi:hypothetical protein
LHAHLFGQCFAPELCCWDVCTRGVLLGCLQPRCTLGMLSLQWDLSPAPYHSSCHTPLLRHIEPDLPVLRKKHRHVMEAELLALAELRKRRAELRAVPSNGGGGAASGRKGGRNGAGRAASGSDERGGGGRVGSVGSAGASTVRTRSNKGADAAETRAEIVGHCCEVVAAIEQQFGIVRCLYILLLQKPF